MSEGELILYTTEDGAAKIELRSVDGTVWLTQAQMTDLFQTTPQAITQLVRAIYDEEELSDPAWDYFDELLERIRDIRASEARFYQMVRDLLALSEDYDPKSRGAFEIYAKIQNKMFHAVTNHTAAELIAARADPDRPNMGLTAWTGARVRKGDVSTRGCHRLRADT